jgi:hypothetical protein
MSGWIALLFALVFHVDHWYLYLPAGLFVGAVFEAIKMRSMRIIAYVKADISPERKYIERG